MSSRITLGYTGICLNQSKQKVHILYRKSLQLFQNKMTDKHIQKQKAKTTRQLTDDLKYVVKRNKVLEDKMYKMEELLKKVMEKYKSNSDNMSEGNWTKKEPAIRSYQILLNKSKFVFVIKGTYPQKSNR